MGREMEKRRIYCAKPGGGIKQEKANVCVDGYAGVYAGECAGVWNSAQIKLACLLCAFCAALALVCACAPNFWATQNAWAAPISLTTPSAWADEENSESLAATSAASAATPTSLTTSTSAISATSATANENSASSINIDWYTKNPSASTFSISTADELRGLSALVNGTADINGDGEPDNLPINFQGKTINQESGINLTTPSQTSWNETLFTPIGSAEHPFSGTYDGGENSIYGLCVKNVYTYAGLFGVTSSTSTLKGVRIEAGDGINTPYSNIEIEAQTQLVRHVGSLVGRSEGVIENCMSAAALKVLSNTKATKENKYVVQNVGGLIGSASGDISDCHFLAAGSLVVKVTTDAYTKGDSDQDSTQAESLRVADSFGGVVGHFGDVKTYGTLDNCTNDATIWVCATGAGAKDRFNIVTYAAPFFVGGVCGYSNGNISNCINGTFDSLRGEVSGLVSTANATSPTDDPEKNQGADQIAGIVGGLRSVSDDPNKYNDGSPDCPVSVTNCQNFGQITGRVSVAGCVGEAGSYTTVSQCRNGIPSQEVPGAITSTRWNKPISGGVLGRTWGGVIAWCANYATIRNTQTGYYMAGVCGALFKSSDYADLMPEMYGCLNTGNIYTANTSTSVEYREAGLLGQNEGYVHDCIMLKGTVPYHSDAAIGANDWGYHDHIYVQTQAEIQTAQSAAILNKTASQNEDWNTYWFINASGYPILNTWVTDIDRVGLSADNIASTEMLKEAPYLGSAEPTPTLSITLTNGTKLVQNTDFYVIPQEGAIEMSGGEQIYSASIVGLGLYYGTVENCAPYAIGKGDLSLANVRAADGKYNFGKVQFPTSVSVAISGKEINASEYNYIIYDSRTGQIGEDGPSTGDFEAYDSLGFVSFDNGVTLESVSGKDLNSESRAYILYNRDYEKISDSTGAIYYTSHSGGGTEGEVVSSRHSCTSLKSGAPAGYTIYVQANDQSAFLEGAAQGYYVVKALNIRDDCSINSLDCQGQTWYWDDDHAEFYQLDSSGQRLSEAPYATFTGEQILPSVSMSCEDRVLVEGTDYMLVAGDPNPEKKSDEQSSDPVQDSLDPVQESLEATTSSSSTDETVAALSANDAVTTNSSSADEEAAAAIAQGSRNATGQNLGDYENIRAALTIRPVDTNNMTNYIIGYFEIAPAKFEDCTISLDSPDWAYTGEELKPKVKVELNGVELVENVDYTVAYANNIDRGQATYTVTPLTNLSGGTTTPYTGIFNIVAGTNISSLFIDDINDMQFNFGYDVNPTLTFRESAGGKVLNLEKGIDYTVEYSTTQITKWPSTQTIKDACVATIKGTGKYSGQTTKKFHIIPFDASKNENNQLQINSQVLKWGAWSAADANGAGVASPIISISAYPIVNWDTMEKGEMRTISSTMSAALGKIEVTYFDSADAQLSPPAESLGTYKAKITFETGSTGVCGGATGTMEQTIQYQGTANIKDDVNWSFGTDRSYTGKAIEPISGATKGGNIALVEGKDYTITYSNNINAGEASFTITSLEGSNFEGTYAGTFTIAPARIADVAQLASVDIQAYTGSEVCPKPALTFKDTGEALVEGQDFVYAYHNNINTGTAAVIINAQGNYTGRISASFRISGFVVKEVSGTSRIGTAIAAAKNAYPQGAQGVIVATSSNYPDALSASSLAGALNFPILLVDDASIEQVATAISELEAKELIAIGSPSSVSSKAFRTLGKLVGGNAVRLAGENRYDTNMAVFDYGQARGLWEGDPVIATGSNYPDALSISSYTAVKASPLFLVDNQTGFSDEAASALIGEYAASRTIIVGGTGSVSLSVESWLNINLGKAPVRLAGGLNNSYPASRYGTSAAIADFCKSEGMSFETLAFATGENYPDALVAGPLQAKNNGPILLSFGNTNKGGTDLTCANALKGRTAETKYLFFFGGSGQTDALPQAFREQIIDILEDEQIRYACMLCVCFAMRLAWQRAARGLQMRAARENFFMHLS